VRRRARGFARLLLVVLLRLGRGRALFCTVVVALLGRGVGPGGGLIRHRRCSSKYR
jgi:hypothetical protein